MKFIWRRRSTSIAKFVAVLMVIWFIKVFLLGTDDTRRASKWNGISLGLISDGGGGGGGGVPGEVVGGRAGGDEFDYSVRGRGAAADVPIAVKRNGGNARIPSVETVIDANKRDINNRDESMIDNMVVLQQEIGAIKFKKHPTVAAAPVAERGGNDGVYAKQHQEDDGKVVLNAPSVVEDDPGEMGKPVVMPANLTAEMKKIVDEGWTNNGFNQYASDLISVHRSLPDFRDAWCKEPGRYQTNLPATDVIICFHNEAWSVLLRTVHSVLDRSPEHLIGRIILVDDFSDMPHTKTQLEDYIKAYPKVKIIRAPKREGLIRARLLGARHAESPVLTYLDSHCECAEGWLEPLLDRIARNSTTVVCPTIDTINHTTMEYHYYSPSKPFLVGGFNWFLEFKWNILSERERKRHNNSAEPVYTPTMAGGLFSIDRKFFELLGTYDSGFDIWGGENLELSFKTWMCGGTLEIIPCSHVGHIFRKRSPYLMKFDATKKNSIRLAEVWMDDYAKYFYQSMAYHKVDFGDVTERKELRKHLGCKSFKWFLDNIYPEHPIPDEPVAYGEIRNLGYGGSTCLDSPGRKPDFKKPVGIYHCLNQGGSQYFMLSKTGEIRRDKVCLDYDGSDLMILACHGWKGNQFWTYKADTNQLRHDPTDKCLAINEKIDKVIMEECYENRAWQKWHLENYDPSKL